MATDRTIQSRITRASRVISLIGLAGLLFLAAITVGEVLLRWLFKYPILGVSDVSRLVVTVVVASCLPLVSAERRHITVRMVGKTIGPRANAILEAFGAFVAMVILGLMAWQLWLYAEELASTNETTWVVLWPVAPWWKVTTVLIALCFPNQLACLFISLRSAFSRRKGEA